MLQGGLTSRNDLQAEADRLTFEFVAAPSPRIDPLTDQAYGQTAQRLGSRANRRTAIARSQGSFYAGDMSSPPQTIKLLPDRGTSEDLLEHRAIASTLASAIRGAARDDSLGLALYGRWGQGKSTIGALLEEALAAEIEAGRLRFIRIDAWKYAYEGSRLPLRRHFLIKAYEAAGLDAEVAKLREGRYERSQSNLREDVKMRFASLADRGTQLTLLRAAIVVGFVIVVGVLGGFRTLYWLVSGVLALVVAALVSVLPTISNGLYVTAREDPAWTIEVFDEWLDELFTKSNDDIDRFVFFIDDLDRCSDELVVETIATLQAFFGRARCAYLVAADEEQLKRAIRHRGTPGQPASDSSPGQQENFLDKIFQVSVQVPRLAPFAVQEYARAVARETRLHELPVTERDSVLAYLAHPGVLSPRQVRVVINDFLLTWLLADHREASDGAHLQPGELTGAKLLLAKLVVLRLHFGWFYELLSDDPDLLTRYQRQQLGYDVVVPQDAKLVEDAARRATHEAETEGAAEALTESLVSYLALTRRTLGVDASQIQEFVDLRGRPEFLELPGRARTRLRIALESGDAASLQRVIATAPETVDAAIRAALTLADETNPVRREAGRRSLLALAELASRTQLNRSGAEIANRVYGDEIAATDEVVSERTEGHARLVRWMPHRVLRAFASVAPLDKVDDLTDLARAVADKAPDSWSEICARALATKQADVVAAAVGRVKPTLVRRLLAHVLAGVQPTLEGPTDIEEGIVGTVTAISGTRITVQTAEGVRGVYLPTSRPVGLEVGMSVSFGGHLDYESDLVIDQLVGGGNTLLDEDIPQPVTDAERDAAWTLLSSAASRAARRNGVTPTARLLVRLPSFDWQRREDALRAVGLCDALFASAGLQEATLGVALCESEPIARYPDVEARAAAAALTSMTDAALPGVVSAAFTAAAEALPELSATQMRSVGDDLLQGTKRARSVAPDATEAAARELDLPTDADEAAALVRLLLAPADPGGTAERLVNAALPRIQSLQGERSEDTDEVVSSLATLARASEVDPRAARNAIKRLPTSIWDPAYTVAVLELRHLTDALALSLPAGFLRASATYNIEGARLTQLHALKRSSITRSELAAVLEGIAKRPAWDAESLSRYRELVDRRRSVMPPIEQLAVIASHGGRGTAERIFGEDLLPALFDEATRRIKDSRPATLRLLAGIAAWGTRNRPTRQYAASRFIELLGLVRNEGELRLVVRGMLAFYRRPADVDRVRDTRRALRKAIERMSEPLSEPTREALIRARTELRVEPAGQTWFSDLVEAASGS